MNSIIDYLYNHLDSEEYDKGVLLYGLQVIVYNAFTLLLMLVLSFLLNDIIFGLYFIPMFAFLRVIIGGYHCTTIIRCTSLMTMIYIVINYLQRLSLYRENLPILSLVMILCLFFIKQCEENTIKFKNYSMQMKYFLILFFIVLSFFKQYAFYIPVFSALLVVELMYYAYLIKKTKLAN